jgi:hypothetical protein
LRYQALSGKDTAVRGSPIIRTILVSCCLGIAALLLWKLTTVRTPQPVDGPPATTDTPNATLKKVPFSLVLSAPTTEINLRDPQGALLYEGKFATSQTEINGVLDTLPEIIHLSVQWQSISNAQHYFAKMRLDVPGKDTLTHVFDASTHIDDIWELP